MHIDKFEDLQVKDWRWGFTKSIKSRGVSKICLFLNLEVKMWRNIFQPCWRRNLLWVF